jgi:hypothetical protein
MNEPTSMSETLVLFIVQADTIHFIILAMEILNSREQFIKKSFLILR